jgi:hypothetical protein
MKKKPSKPRKLTPAPLRFAHPFFQPVTDRPPSPFGARMLDHIQGTLHPIPPLQSAPEFQLSDIIGASAVAAIAATGVLQFHTVGDTGLPAQPGETPQEMVAAEMTADYNVSQAAHSPAFFLHLGDVVYGPSKDANYRGQFYEPYIHYPGKIIAIPGNHDGETFASSDPVTLRAYLANFCAASASVPPVAGSIFRQTMTQPGAYWLLDAPFIQIVGLYSNTAENPGFISGTVPGAAQKTWLLASLTKIVAARAGGNRKALAFAAHHPPYSSGGHTGSTAMLADIDGVCQSAGIFPDLFLSGHAHSYQRYTRFVSPPGGARQIPFFVVGCGGHGDQPVTAANGQRTGDLRFDASYRGYGYALISVSAQNVKFAFYSVANDARQSVDEVTLDLQSGVVTTG